MSKKSSLGAKIAQLQKAKLAAKQQLAQKSFIYETEEIIPIEKPTIAKKIQQKVPIDRLSKYGVSKDNRVVKTFEKTIVEIKPVVEKEYKLKSPVVGVFGHVDVGKTSLLDKIRSSTVQKDEASGITQQLGATLLSSEIIEKVCKPVIGKRKIDFKIPGLLILDTPGHEAFSAMRTSALNICDITIVVVDIMHGLEKQTIEVIKNLIESGKKVVLALNKLDMVHGYLSNSELSLSKNIKQQKSTTLYELKRLTNFIIVQMAELGLNAKHYREIKDWDEWIPLIPISAKYGDGLPDLFLLLSELSQRKLFLHKEEKVSAYVYEVSTRQGFGEVLDIILTNGTIKVGDTFTVAGPGYAIEDTIAKILLFPQNQEFRDANLIVSEKATATSIVRIIGKKSFKYVLSGSKFILGTETFDNLCSEWKLLESCLDPTSDGIHVSSSTLGSCLALLNLLKPLEVKIKSFSIGSVSKKDVIKVCNSKHKIILAFESQVSEKAMIFAKEQKVYILTDTTVYRLVEKLEKYLEKRVEQEQENNKLVYPCILKLVEGCIFRNENPMIIGVEVVEGILYPETKLIIPQVGYLGMVSSIQKDSTVVDYAEMGKEVAISIVDTEKNIIPGKSFGSKEYIVSRMTRKDLDVAKEFYRKEVKKYLPVYQKVKKILGL